MPFNDMRLDVCVCSVGTAHQVSIAVFARPKLSTMDNAHPTDLLMRTTNGRGLAVRCSMSSRSPRHQVKGAALAKTVGLRRIRRLRRMGCRRQVRFRRVRR